MASSKVMTSSSNSDPKKTVDEIWRDIVSGHRTFKTEPNSNDEMMTLEDFLVKTGAAEPAPAEVKVETLRMGTDGVFGLELSQFPSGEWSGAENGRGKRRADNAAEQRHRRMIKNRESAARSRERKQAYQAELESLAVKLEEENEKLVKEKVAHTKERFNQLMERVVPVIEKRKPPRSLRRSRSMQW